MQDTNVVIRQRINIDAKDLIFRVRSGSSGGDRHVILLKTEKPAWDET